MIGRRVRNIWGETGTVIQWEPLGSALCDCLVDIDGGQPTWHGSTSLQPADDRGPLPSRHAAQVAADEEALQSLQTIRAQHVADWHKPWPGCEHGKAIIGQALDGAIADVKSRLERSR